MNLLCRQSLLSTHTHVLEGERERESNSVDEEEDSTRCPRLCGWGVASFGPFFFDFLCELAFVPEIHIDAFRFGSSFVAFQLVFYVRVFEVCT